GARQRARFEPCRGGGKAAWWQRETRGQRAWASRRACLAAERRGFGQRCRGAFAHGSRDQADVTAFFERIADTPKVFDAARGADVLDGLKQALGARSDFAEARRLLDAPRVAELLLASFSASPYLAALALRRPALLADSLSRDPDAHLDGARAELAKEVDTAASPKEAMAALRRFKQRIALLTGLADLGGVWTTELALRAMSLAADAALQSAVGFLFRRAREAEQVAPPAGAPF